MNIYRNNLNRKKLPCCRSGFTLIEVLVAISILAVVITATMSLVTNNISITFIAKNQLLANHLANEGIELVRQKRDSNILAKANGSGINWNDGFSEMDCGSGRSCWVSALNISNGNFAYTPQIGSCSSGGCGSILELKTNASGMLGHSHSGGGWGVPTNFYRKIETISLNTNEIRIISTVGFTLKNKTREVVVEKVLRNISI